MEELEQEVKWGLSRVVDDPVEAAISDLTYHLNKVCKLARQLERSDYKVSFCDEFQCHDGIDTDSLYVKVIKEGL